MVHQIEGTKLTTTSQLVTRGNKKVHNMLLMDGMQSGM